MKIGDEDRRGDAWLDVRGAEFCELRGEFCSKEDDGGGDRPGFGHAANWL